jgi:hypothetical protein
MHLVREMHGYHNASNLKIVGKLSDFGMMSIDVLFDTGFLELSLVKVAQIG